MSGALVIIYYQKLPSSARMQCVSPSISSVMHHKCKGESRAEATGPRSKIELDREFSAIKDGEGE